MLECVLVVGHIVVVVVGIGKEGAARGKYVRSRDIGCRELSLVRILYHEYVLRLAVEILAELISQVGVGVAVAYNLHRF